MPDIVKAYGTLGVLCKMSYVPKSAVLVIMQLDARA